MKRIYFFLILPIALLCGCEKSFESFTPTQNTHTDTVWANPATGNFTDINTLHENLVRAALTDSFNLTLNSVIEFPDNIRIEVPANSLVLNGAALTGKANIELVLLKSKGDFIRFRKPTTSNGYLLESGGSFNLNISKAGQPLSILQGRQIKVSYRITNTSDSMVGFTGNGLLAGTGNANFNWQRDTSVFVRTTQLGYDVFTNKLNWINCDYFKDTAALKTRIALLLPAAFTNSNTSCFIVYKSIKGVMQLEADAPNRIWRKDKVPVNKQVICVTISKIASDYYLGTKETVTATNQNIELRPEKKSLQEIKNFLDAL